jgi:nucleoside-diphosphate-sugar epimerase
VIALVTGSTGFLGSHLVERLRAAGHRVRALARNLNKARILEGTGAEVVVGDVTSPESLESASKGVDVVFHVAALVTNWGPWSDFQKTTVQGTDNLLQAAARAAVTRFVHISTIRVYDDRYCRRRRVVTEEAPQGRWGFRQFGHYARAKVLAEAAVWSWTDRLPVTVIRPAWIYGPREEAILPPLIRFLRSPRARWPCLRDPCADPIYVTDVADCAIASAQHPSAVGQAFNASPQSRISVREFLGALCDSLGVNRPKRAVPYFLASLTARVSEWGAWLVRSRSAPTITRAGLAILTQDIRHDPAKAERFLGWRAKVGLNEGIHNTATWLREHRPELLW